MLSDKAKELQSLTGPLDFVVEKSKNLQWGLDVRFCKNQEERLDYRYSAMIIFNQVDNTCYVKDEPNAYGSHEPLEVCDLYTRMGEFIRRSGFTPKRGY